MYVQVRSAILQSGDEVRFLPNWLEDAAQRANEMGVYPWVSQVGSITLEELAPIPTQQIKGYDYFTLGFADRVLRVALRLAQAVNAIQAFFGTRGRSPVCFFRLLNGNVLQVSPPCMMVFDFWWGGFTSDTIVTLEEVDAVAILEIKRRAEAVV
jgi:hypothetical protein